VRLRLIAFQSQIPDADVDGDEVRTISFARRVRRPEGIARRSHPRERRGTAGNPSILINSIDVRRLLQLIEADNHASITAYLVAELGRLPATGVHLGMIAANTPDLVFDDVLRESPIHSKA
jgi:hypothetical protein